jgi:hypothetical protein
VMVVNNFLMIILIKSKGFFCLTSLHKIVFNADL